MLIEAVKGHAASRPDSVAIEWNEQRISWRETWQKAQYCANFLVSNGVGPGDRVGLLSPSCPEYIFSILACAMTGAVCTPFSLMLKSETLISLIKDSQPKIVLSASSGVKIMDDLSEAGLPAITYAFEDALIESKTNADSVIPISMSEPMSLVYSSGTTGVPKGILHSRTARDAYANIFAIEYGIQQDSRTLLATPLYSNGTWMTLLPTMLAGGCSVFWPDQKTSDWCEIIERKQITHAFLVPTQLNEVFANGPIGVSGETVTIISAGSFLPLTTKRSILSSENVILFELYGNTEGVATILRPYQMERGFDSVGTAITTGEIRITESNEICGRSPLQSDGYYNRPQLTKDLFLEDDTGKKFVRSGDIGAVGDDGFLRLKGRLKDMIVSGGVNVYPIDIETVLEGIDGVREAAVIGVPHEKWGETPLAFVVFDSPSSCTKKGLISVANDRLNKHQRLSDLVMVDQLPRNALGKVIKAQLLMQYREVLT